MVNANERCVNCIFMIFDIYRLKFNMIIVHNYSARLAAVPVCVNHPISLG